MIFPDEFESVKLIVIDDDVELINVNPVSVDGIVDTDMELEATDVPPGPVAVNVNE